MNILKKLKNYFISKITSRIIITLTAEINKEISKQNEDLYALLEEEFAIAIAREQHIFNKIQSQEIFKQLDVIGRTLRGKGFN